MGRRRFAKKGEAENRGLASHNIPNFSWPQDVRHFKLVARPGADDDDGTGSMLHCSMSRVSMAHEGLVFDAGSLR